MYLPASPASGVRTFRPCVCARGGDLDAQSSCSSWGFLSWRDLQPREGGGQQEPNRASSASSSFPKEEEQKGLSRKEALFLAHFPLIQICARGGEKPRDRLILISIASWHRQNRPMSIREKGETSQFWQTNSFQKNICVRSFLYWKLSAKNHWSMMMLDKLSDKSPHFLSNQKIVGHNRF